jgi:hypothetical protein
MKLYDATQGGYKEILNETVETKSSFVHAFTPLDFKSGVFGRKIEVLDLQPGTYRIHASTLEDAPELAGTPCQLSIESYANLRFTPSNSRR